MNDTSSLEQISKTSKLDSILILRQYELDLMARFIEIINIDSQLRQEQKAKKIGCSSGTLKRYKQDINMLSPYRISSNTHRRRHGPKKNLKGLQFNSNYLKRPQLTSKEPTNEILVNSMNETLKKNKSFLEGGTSQAEAVEIDDEHLTKIII